MSKHLLLTGYLVVPNIRVRVDAGCMGKFLADVVPQRMVCSIVWVGVMCIYTYIIYYIHNRWCFQLFLIFTPIWEK